MSWPVIGKPGSTGSLLPTRVRIEAWAKNRVAGQVPGLPGFPVRAVRGLPVQRRREAAGTAAHRHPTRGLVLGPTPAPRSAGRGAPAPRPGFQAACGAIRGLSSGDDAGRGRAEDGRVSGFNTVGMPPANGGGGKSLWDWLGEPMKDDREDDDPWAGTLLSDKPERPRNRLAAIGGALGGAASYMQQRTQQQRAGWPMMPGYGGWQ